MENDRRVEDIEMKLVGAKIDSHIDMCIIRYEAIHARLKRIETILITIAGALMLLLLNIAFKVH